MPLFLLNALSVARQHLRTIVVLGAALCMLYVVSTGVAALVPDVRVSISMGRGVLSPKLICFICRL